MQQQTSEELIIEIPSTKKAIAELVSNDGNLPLAAHRLKVTESDLLQVLISDKVALDTLINQLRARILIRNYRTLIFMQDEIQGSVPKMKASEKINYYKVISESLSELLGKPSSTIDTLLASMPEEPRNALMQLLHGESDMDNE